MMPAREQKPNHRPQEVQAKEGKEQQRVNFQEKKGQENRMGEEEQ